MTCCSNAVHIIPTIHATVPSINDHEGLCLLTYCQSGNCAEVKRNLKTMTVAEVNKSDPKTGDTPLHLATRHGHIEIVRLLIEHGAMRQVRNNKNKTPVQETKSNDMKVLFNRSTPRFVVLDSQNTFEWMATSKRAIRMFFAHSSQGLNISSDSARICFNAMSNASEVANAGDKSLFWPLLQEAHQNNNAIYFLKAYTVESSFYSTVNQSLARRPIDDLMIVDDDDSIESFLELASQVLNNGIRTLDNIRYGRPIQPINGNVGWPILFLQSIYPFAATPEYKFRGRTYRGLRISKEELRRYTKESIIYNKTLISTSKSRNIAESFMIEKKATNEKSPLTTSQIPIDDGKVPVLCIYHIKGLIMFAIDLENVSEYSHEQEVLVLPFPLIISKVKHKKSHTEIQLKSIFSNAWSLIKQMRQWAQAES